MGTNGATLQAHEVLIAGYGFLASTGGFTYQAPIQVLSGACASPYCLFPGYQVLATTGTFTLTETTANVTNWGAVLVGLKGDNSIFGDGFENGVGVWSALFH